MKVKFSSPWSQAVQDGNVFMSDNHRWKTNQCQSQCDVFARMSVLPHCHFVLMDSEEAFCVIFFHLYIHRNLLTHSHSTEILVLSVFSHMSVKCGIHLSNRLNQPGAVTRAVALVLMLPLTLVLYS